jgi:spermidine/putrescine transport system permease protein
VYLFLYAPIAVLILYSFNASIQTAAWKGFTTRWYGVALRSQELTEAARNSLIIAAVTTLNAIIVGTTAALGLHRLASRRRGGAMTRALLFLPIVIPEIVVGAALLTFFVALQWQRGFWTTVAAHVSFSVSYVAIVVRARLAGFDPSLEEAARDLGASPVGVFWRVKLPLILPGIIAGALLVFTLSIDDYVITSFASGIKMLPLEIYSRLKVSAKPEVNAVSTILLVFTIMLIAVAQWLIRGGRSKGEGR